MSQKIIAGNWKMNLNSNEIKVLISSLENNITKSSKIKAMIFPPFPYIQLANSLTNILKVGAQNCSAFNKGAYTGEVSAEMVKDIGARYVLVGHSERRQQFNEENDVLTLKLRRAVESKLKVIFCVGETLEERELGTQNSTISKQLSILKEFNFKVSQLIIAYEPVWAIGTGKTANVAQISEMHSFIHEYLSNTLSQDFNVLYGGSCKPTNAKEILDIESVNGVLVGGASLNAKDFLSIINSAL